MFTAPLFALYLLSGSFYAIGQIYTETLFLKAYGASGLSRFFVYNGIALILTGIIYNYILLRFSLKKGYYFLVVLFSTLIYLSLTPGAAEYSWLPFYLFLGNYLFTFFLDIHFFNYSYQFLSIRSSKRLLPLIMGGGKLGGITVSLLMISIFSDDIISTGGIFWLINGALLVVPVFIVGYVSGSAERRASVGKNELLPDAKILDRIIRHVNLSYSTPIFAMSVLAVFVMAVVNLIAEYYFARTFVRAFPAQNELAYFLSVYTFVSDFITLLVQVLITSRIISLLGVRKSNYIYPGSFMAFMSLMIFSPGLIAGIMLRFFRKNLSMMFRHPVFNVIMASAPRDRVAEVKSFISGIVLPLGMVAGGGAILLIYKKLPDVYGYALALSTGLLYLALTFLQNRAYVRSLRDQLSNDADTVNADGKDALDVAALTTDGDMVQMNLPLLDALFAEKADADMIQPLLPYFSELSSETKEGIIAVAATSGRAVREPVIYAAIKDQDPFIRGKALAMIKGFPYRKRVDLLQGYPTDRMESEQMALELLMVNEAEAHGDGDLESSSFVISLLTGEKGGPSPGKIPARIQALKKKVLAGKCSPLEFSILSRVMDPELFMNDLADLAIATGDQVLFRALIPHAESLDRRTAMKILNRFIDAPVRLLAGFAAQCPILRETDKALLLDYRYDLGERDMGELFRDDEALARLLQLRVFQKYGYERKSNYLKCLISLNRKPRKVMIDFIRLENDIVKEIILIRRMLKTLTLSSASRFLDIALRGEIDLRKHLMLKAIGVITGAELDYIYESGIFLRDSDVTGYILEFIESSGKVIRDSIFIFEDEMLEAQAAIPLDADDSGADPAAVLLRTISFMPELADLLHYAAARVLMERDVPTRLEYNFRSFRRQEEEDMLSVLGKILFLKSNQLFGDIHVTDLIRIARITRELEIPAGKTLIKENEQGDDLYIVVDGEVEVFKGRKVIETLSNGSCIGELAIIDREPRSATVKTRRKTRLLSINRKDFLLTLKENPAIAINVMKVITQRLRKSIAR